MEQVIHCNTVVVVTCDRDRHIFDVQCQSFSQYLNVSNLVIVVNEYNSDDWLKWFLCRFKNLFRKFNLTIITLDQFKLPDNIWGYYRQQLCKLLIHNHIECDSFWILDSKNILLQQMHIGDFLGEKRTPVKITNTDDQSFENLYNTFEKYKVMFDAHHLTEVQPASTPFLIKRQVANALQYSVDLIDIFNYPSYNQNLWISEFWLYDIKSQAMGITEYPHQPSRLGNDNILLENITHFTWWWGNAWEYSPRRIFGRDYITKMRRYQMFSPHWRLFADPKYLKIIKNIFEDRNLEYKGKIDVN